MPENSLITKDFKQVDYYDTYRIIKSTNNTAEEIANNIFQLPNWAKLLLSIRNFAVKFLGLKKGKFAVIEKNKNEIVMGDNDKHLNFRVSVLIDKANSFIYLTTLVSYNNILGRIYFFLIKPFHKMICKAILKSKYD